MDGEALDELLDRVQLAGPQHGEDPFGGVGEEDVQWGRWFGQVGHRSPPAARARAKASEAGVHCWPPIGAASEAIACSSVRRVRRWR